ncbi:MAG: hypothetical protein Q4A00_05605 [Flavobacteriaceae bacterium]|nr:hypothetical protein [Flavobacteriaceae bacterium]
MKKILTFISICLALVFVVSCSSRKPTKQDFQEPIVLTQTKEVKEIVRDTIYRMEADSSFYKAYIDCRDGKPKLIHPKTQSGKKLPPPKVDIDKEGNLTIKAESKAQELFKQWKEQHITEKIPVPIYVPKPVYIEKPFAWYHKILLWAGGISLSILAIGVLLTFFKPKFLK